jgi:DNA polymerase V
MLESVPVGAVWGIGRQYEKLLREYGVTTARGLKNLPSRWVKARMTVTGRRTALELSGMPASRWTRGLRRAKPSCVAGHFPCGWK